MVAERIPEQTTRMTEAEYLAYDRASDIKNEYYDGWLVAMAGTSPDHSIITVNVGTLLNNQLEERPCLVFSPDQRTRIAESKLYAYPDITVVCGQPEYSDDNPASLLNPTVIIEVLSDSTEARDRGFKAAAYRQRPSLQEYVLVAQDRISVERFSRQGDLWVLAEATSRDAVIDLPSITCALPLRRVYAKTDLLASLTPPADPATEVE